MKTKVEIHDLFQNSYDELDGSIKSRVLNFIIKLQQDSDAYGLDFKQPKGAASKHVRTARVTDNYRAVLVNAGAEDDSDRLYLVAVKKHDDAYKFAETLTLQVNEKTGAAELYDPIALGDKLMGRVFDHLPVSKQTFEIRTERIATLIFGQIWRAVPTLGD